MKHWKGDKCEVEDDNTRLYFLFHYKATSTMQVRTVDDKTACYLDKGVKNGK